MNYSERIPVPRGYVSVVEVMRGVWTVTGWQVKTGDGYGMDRNFFLVLDRKSEALKRARRMARERWRAAPAPTINAPPEVTK